MAKDNIVSFSLHEEGVTSGELWVGEFKAKQRLTMRDQLNRDKIRRELLGSMGGTSDDRALSIAVLVAELTVRLVESPKWWAEMSNGLDLEDDNILVEVYNKAKKIEDDAKAARRASTQTATEDLKKISAEKADDK